MSAPLVCTPYERRCTLPLNCLGELDEHDKEGEIISYSHPNGWTVTGSFLEDPRRIIEFHAHHDVFGCVYGKCSECVVADRQESIDNFLACFPHEYLEGDYCDCCECDTDEYPCHSCPCTCLESNEESEGEEKVSERDEVERDRESDLCDLVMFFNLVQAEEEEKQAKDDNEFVESPSENTENVCYPTPDFVVKYLYQDFLPKHWSGEIGALPPSSVCKIEDEGTLAVNELGTLTHDSGWTITGFLRENYYEYVDKFHARHPEFGCIYGSFSKHVIAPSDEAFEHFIKHHEPTSYDPNDE